MTWRRQSPDGRSVRCRPAALRQFALRQLRPRLRRRGCEGSVATRWPPAVLLSLQT